MDTYIEIARAINNDVADILIDNYHETRRDISRGDLYAVYIKICKRVNYQLGIIEEDSEEARYIGDNIYQDAIPAATPSASSWAAACAMCGKK